MQRPDEPALSLPLARQIDEACDRFEAQWKAGRTPRLEAFLSTADEACRTSLFSALLSVELELFARRGQLPALADYQQRFPSYESQVVAAFDDARHIATERAASQEGTICTSAAETSRADESQPPASPLPPRIGKFEIQRLLGKGGFGAVYLARDPDLNRPVAVKVPRSGLLQTVEERARFLREAQALAALRHPNICPVYEVGEPEGRCYLVMAYLEGQTLAERLNASPQVEPRRAADDVRVLALALAEAHRKGIVHRDLKPANIMVDEEHGDLVIMDFGLARRTGAEDTQLTRSGQAVGTPSYMSPEQARGELDKIGPACDVYSLGVILYEMLTGQRPFQGPMAEVMAQILHATPKPPSELAPQVDPALEAICLRAMSKDCSARYASMTEFAAALSKYLHSGASPMRSAAPTVTPAGPFDPYSEWLKIPLARRPPTHYDLLGLADFEADAATIHRATMDRMANVRRYQLGVHSEAAQRLIGELSRAFDCLSTPDRKRTYDDELLARLAQPQTIATKPAELPKPLATPQTVTKVLTPILQTTLSSITPAARRKRSRPPRWPWIAATAAIVLLGIVLLVRTEYGTVRIELLDPDLAAEVRLDGHLIEIKGLEDPLEIAVGPHQLEVRTKNLKLHTKAFTVLRGPNESVRVDLTPLADPPAVAGMAKAPAQAPPPPPTTAQRNPALVQLEVEVQAGVTKDAADPRNQWVRKRLVEFLRTHRGTPDGLAAVGLMSQVAWPADALRRDKIPSYELTAAGNGDPKQAPPTLVAVLGDSRLKHWASVNSIALSSDDRFLASASSDNTVRIWDAVTGEQRHVLYGHSATVSAVAICPDNKILASASHDTTVKLWDVDSGRLLDTLAGHTSSVYCVAFDPSGTLVSSGGNDRLVKVWSVKSRRLIHTLKGHTAGVAGVHFHPHGKLLASCSIDKTIRIWDLATGIEHLKPLTGHTEHVVDVVFNPDGKLLASTSYDKTVKVWDPLTGEEKQSVVQADASVCAAFSPDGMTLASAGNRDLINLWDLAQPTESRSLPGHMPGVNWLAYSSDGKALFSAGDDGSVRVWDVAKGSMRLQIEGHHSVITKAEFSLDGETIASSSYDGTVRVWNTSSSTSLNSFDNQFRIEDVAIAPDSRTICFVARSTSRSLSLWDSSGNVEPFRLQKYWPYKVAISPDGHLVATANSEKVFDRNSRSIAVWDLATKKQRTEITPPTVRMFTVAFSPDSRLLAAGGSDSIVRVWDLKTGREIHSFKAHRSNINQVAFSPDATLLVSASSGNALKLWSLAEGTILGTLEGHTAAVSDVAFSPDGRTLASAANDGTVRLWDVGTCAQKATIPLGPAGGGISGVAFSPEGRHVITANGNGTMYVLRLSEELLARTPDNPPSAAIPEKSSDSALQEKILSSLVYVRTAGEKRSPLGVVTESGVCTIMPGTFRDVDLVTLDGKRTFSGRVASRKPFPFCWIDCDEMDLPPVKLAPASTLQPQDVSIVTRQDAAANFDPGHIDASGAFSTSSTAGQGPIFTPDGVCVGFGFRLNRDKPLVIHALKRE